MADPGKGPGGGGPGHPLLLYQSEARRAEKKIFLRPGLLTFETGTRDERIPKDVCGEATQAHVASL